MSGYVGKIKVDGQNPVLVGSTLYGICNSGIAATGKEVTLNDFDSLLPGVTVHVRFVNGNSATTGLTLKVGSTTAQTISGNCVCAANDVIAFTLEDSSGVKTWRANHSILVEEGTTNGTIKVAGQTVSVHGLGAAAYKGVDTSISPTTSNSSDIPTTAAVVQYVTDQTGGLNGLTGAMHFRGIYPGSTAPSATGTASDFSSYISGDVVLFGDKEYVYIKGADAASSNWVELGDESSYALDDEVVKIPGGSTAGDMLYFSSGQSGAYTRLPIGTAGQLLKVSNGAPAWATGVPSDVALGNVSNNSILNGENGTKGQILYWSNTNTPARLDPGTNGHVLTLTNGVPTWSANVATDEKVTQNILATSNSNLYPLLLSAYIRNATDTDATSTNRVQDIYVQPSTGTLYATKFVGNGSELTNVTASSVAWSGITDVPTAGLNTLGVVKTSSNVSTTTGLTAAPIISGVVYYKDTTYQSAGSVNALTSLYLSYIDSSATTQTNTLSTTATAIGVVESGVLYLKSLYYGTTSVSTGVSPITSGT